MILRNVVVSLAAVAALAPVVGTASTTEKASLKACTQAFATSLAPAIASVPDFKVAYRTPRFSSALSEYYPAEYTFELEARNSAGAPIARARCAADARGTVTALSALPMPKQGETLASR